MPCFLIDYLPCPVGEAWDDLTAAGLMGELFLPQYLAQCPDRSTVAVDTLNDSFWEWVPLEYTPDQKREMEKYGSPRMVEAGCTCPTQVSGGSIEKDQRRSGSHHAGGAGA